tara:strand:- start:913 stop:1140 length:228 start_codon:yes stop_codon:yes gene_type:complete
MSLSLGFEDLACDFDEGKIVTRYTVHVMEEIPIRGAKRKIRLWNGYYNDLEHCSLDGKTPNEVLYAKVTNALAKT